MTNINEWDGYEKIEHRTADPLSVVHRIQSELNLLRHLVKALETVGLPIANEMKYSIEFLDDLAELCGENIIRETGDRFQAAQQATANMINGILAYGTLDDKIKV